MRISPDKKMKSEVWLCEFVSQRNWLGMLLLWQFIHIFIQRSCQCQQWVISALWMSVFGLFCHFCRSIMCLLFRLLSVEYKKASRFVLMKTEMSFFLITQANEHWCPLNNSRKWLWKLICENGHNMRPRIIALLLQSNFHSWLLN